MTQTATPNSVLGRFDGQEMASRGQRVRLERRGDEFWAIMTDQDWIADQFYERGISFPDARDAPMVARQIVMTTGSHHFQAYWVPGRYGSEVRQLPWVWHIGEGRWMPKADSFLHPPSAEFTVGLWNQNCINCHSTGPIPGLNKETQELFSSAAEFGIACEACHGSGKAHVDHYTDPSLRDQTHVGEHAIVNPARLPPAAASEICGQCHVIAQPTSPDEWWQYGHTRSYRPGEDLTKSRNLLSYQTDRQQVADNGYKLEYQGGIESLFWGDGTVRVGGREYHGLIMSPCYEQGTGDRKLSCLSCHSMHDYTKPDDQLAILTDDNQACTQCHGEDRFTVALDKHTHHPAESSGSQCYNCHMPHTTYALFKGIRSHRVDSPSISTSVVHGRPNACNLCHLDRTLAWTAAHLADWYRIDPPQLDADQQTIAASILWTLKGDAAQRALAAWHMGWPESQAVSGTDWLAPYIAQLLVDPYSAIRFIAHRTAKTLPGFTNLRYNYIGPPDHRAYVAGHVLDAWQQHAADRAQRAAPRDHLLLNADGDVDTQAILRLLDQRDDRPISISE